MIHLILGFTTFELNEDPSVRYCGPDSNAAQAAIDADYATGFYARIVRHRLFDFGIPATPTGPITPPPPPPPDPDPETAGAHTHKSDPKQAKHETKHQKHETAHPKK
jgi:hypothetical protein